jgi:metal-responsive CopG/Arc/MetJ family transcriptional regulator
MARTIIDIPDGLLRELDSVCRLLSVSRAEAVRRALRDWVRHSESVKTDGFGLWRDRADTPAPAPRRRAR